MKPTACIFAFLAAVAFLAAPAWADWDPGDPHKMHFPQLPDLTPLGLDVLAGPSQWEPLQEKFLADDWVCSESGPVLDIHYWGSYNEDMPLMDPLQASFSLVIFSDVPAGVDTPYSHPGQPLWSTYVQPTNARLYATAPESFYDPNQDLIVGQDTQVWQYNFEFDPLGDVFHQQQGETYWLGVHHTFDLNPDGVVDLADVSLLEQISPAAFGWKTADTNLYPPGYEGQHFMDDAVWTDVVTFGGDPHVVPAIPGPDWHELIHPQTGESLDLSFVITNSQQQQFDPRDTNQDTFTRGDDIDGVYANFGAGAGQWDVDGSGLVDQLDVDLLVTGAIPYWNSFYGNANIKVDNIVNGLDATILALNWLTGTTWEQGNFNGAGVTDGLDATLLALNWLNSGIFNPPTPGSGNDTADGAAVPEPATLALAALGTLGLAMLGRRRRRTVK